MGKKGEGGRGVGGIPQGILTQKEIKESSVDVDVKNELGKSEAQ